jgi:hypothetical protein
MAKAMPKALEKAGIAELAMLIILNLMKHLLFVGLLNDLEDLQ